MRKLLLLAVILSTTAACSPPWLVIRQSVPPALRGATHVTVAVDFQSLHMGGEPAMQWLAGRDAERQAAFQEVLQTTDNGFRQGFSERMQVPTSPAQGPPQPGEVRVTAQFVDMVQGKYAVFYREPSSLTTRLVWTVGDEVVDEVEIDVSVDATLSTPAILQRMRMCGNETGQIGARFFAHTQQAE